MAVCRELLISHSWMKMARVVQEHTDKAMVDKAVELAYEDRALHKNGGVLLVADTAAHAQRLITASLHYSLPKTQPFTATHNLLKSLRGIRKIGTREVVWTV